MEHFLLWLLFGLTLLCRGHALLNLLGEKNSVPTIKWDSQSIVDILDETGEIWETCLQNGVTREELVIRKASLRSCGSRFNKQVGKAGNIIKHMASQCDGLDKFNRCYEKELLEVTKECRLYGKDKAYIENSVKINTEISKMMCDNKAKKMLAFDGDGRECAEKKKVKLSECATNHTTKDMQYGTDDCISAWMFVQCVEDELEKCAGGISKIPVEIMTAGLEKTECEDDNPSGSSSLFPFNIIFVITGFIAMNGA